MVDFNKVIRSAMNSGKVFLGSKQALDAAKSGKAAALIAASNCEKKILIDIQRYSELSKIPLCIYPASRADLGAACGKPFAVSVLVIRETTDPDILKMRREINEEDEG